MEKKLFEWVASHIGDNPSTLRLKHSHGKHDFDINAAIVQIECRKKFGRKLADTLEAFPEFYFPSTLAGEQSTSDRLAVWHTQLIPEGETAADLTAGLGIDALHFSRKASGITAVEQNPELVKALEYNAKGLKVDNIKIVNGDCRDFIEKALNAGEHYSAIFIDPARRAADGSRVFALADCEPNVVAMLPMLRKLCNLLVVKMSPMLDISHTASELEGVFSITALGTATECKELVALLDFNNIKDEPVIEGVTLLPDGKEKIFSYSASEERNTLAPAQGTGVKKDDYIFEPYPSVMKTGAFKTLAAAYGLNIFQANTRLFYSSEINPDFPGKIYRVIDVLPYASNVIKRFKRNYPVVNVAVRNFGMTAEALRAKLGVEDKGPLRLYGITDAADKKLLVVTEPID